MAIEITRSSSYDSAESKKNVHVHKNLIWSGLNNHIMQFSSESVADLQCTNGSLESLRYQHATRFVHGLALQIHLSIPSTLSLIYASELKKLSHLCFCMNN